MQEKEHIISVLKNVEKSVKNKNIVSLRNLSNQTIHSSSIEQHPIYIVIAVIIYSLSKILERSDYVKYPSFQTFLTNILAHIEKAIIYLQQDKDEEFYDELKKIREEVSGLSGNFKKHVKEIFEKASIHKASRIYEHGISMERTADLLGITMFDLADYAGKTGISNVNLNITMPVQERIKIAERIFRK